MTESFRHKGQRNKLVNSLREKGIENEQVLEAINSIPRHLFIDSAFESFAYKDEAFPIGSGQTISQPYTVAFQTQLIDPQMGEKILEIGTGSGYQACVLMHMEVKVYTIERQKLLFDKTKKLFAKLKCKPTYFTYGDGYKGLDAFAPYNKILITAASPVVPEELLNQLKIGGRMVLPLGEEKQIMTLIIKESEGNYNYSEHGEFKFVPMLENKAND